MKLAAIELHEIELPLVSPWHTAFGTQTVKKALLVHALAPDGEGWGECVAPEEPLYSPEYVDGALLVIRDHLAPRLLGSSEVTAGQVAPLLAAVKGHPMAKAALEMAVLDAELRAAGIPLAAYLGAVRERVPAGVSVGITETIPALLDQVDAYLGAGYARIKLKIAPGWDVEPVRAVREHVGHEVLLQVDGNGAYRLHDAQHLSRLDKLNLVLIEQPLPEDDLGGHAQLARQVATPICLDESITSARVAAHAIALGACRVVNIKAGRVGGYLEARQIAMVCGANGIAAWCGGMIETGLGRAANTALAACPEFTLPGDLSASDRFFERDITEPFALEDGHIRVPSAPGIGVEPIPSVLAAVTTSVTVIRP